MTEQPRSADDAPGTQDVCCGSKAVVANDSGQRRLRANSRTPEALHFRLQSALPNPRTLFLQWDRTIQTDAGDGQIGSRAREAK